MAEKSYANKFWKTIHFRNLGISIVAGIILLIINEKVWPSSYANVSHIINEFIIVFMAAFAVSAYFEFFLRKGISESTVKLFEIQAEYSKAGIVKFYPNFKDIEIRELFRKDAKKLDIYVQYANTLFGLLNDLIKEVSQKEGVELNIFLLSDQNKFIAGLGELWGDDNSNYDEKGIKKKIQASVKDLTALLQPLKDNGKLKAKVRIYLLKRNPVFHSFYRFDDYVLFVPTKNVAPKDFITIAFWVQRTFNGNGIYDMCIKELDLIKEDNKALDLIFEN